MVLGDLSLSENNSTDRFKAALENRLGSVLPSGSFTVILRSYQGDFRARSTNQSSYSAMILVDARGRKTALERKAEIEALGFRVLSNGDIRLN